MKSSAIRLPRRRFLKLRGNVVELAVGLLVASVLESGAAHAETAPGAGPGFGPAPVPEPGAALPDALKAVGPDQVRHLSVNELKHLLDAKALASLGLDAGFLRLLDTDASAAIRRLEAAFREKVKAAAHGQTKIAASGDAHAHAGGAGDGPHDPAREGTETHHESAALGGLSPLWILGGLAAVGGGVAMAGGGGHHDSAPASTPAPAANVPPAAANDAVTTAEDTPVTFDVRANDRDPDGGTLAVTQVNGTAITTTSPVAITGGSISLGADGRLTFTPAANYNGQPSFTYTLSNGQGSTATATVNLTVTAVNDAPVAAADTFTTAEDAPVTFDVRSNDADADGDKLTVTQVNGTAITTTSPVAVTGGTVSLGEDGRLTFTPAANYNGQPSFTYTVSDGNGGTATATVTGKVTPVNDAPVNALPALVTPVAAGAAVAIPGLSVSDVDGDGATFTTTLSVGHGVLTAGTVAGGAAVTGGGTASLTLTGTLAQVNATLGAVSYASAAGYAGADTLTMVTSDGQATDTDTLGLTVAQVTQGVVIDGYVAGARIFFDANGNGRYDEGEVAATTDAQGRFVLVGTPRGSMIALGGVNTDTGLPNTVALKAPVGAAAVTPLTTLVAELVEDGVDVAEAQARVAHAFGLPDGIDLDGFDFLAPGGDPALAFAVQKVTTQVASLMIQAQAAGVSSASVAEQLARMVGSGAAVDLADPGQLGELLRAVGADPDAAAAIALKTAAINQAVAAATSPDDLVHLVHDLNQPGADLPPVTVADHVATVEDRAVTFDVRDNDRDPEGGQLTVTRVNGVAVAFGGPAVAVEGGSVTLGEDGRLTFRPEAGYHGTPSFTYTVADPAGHASDGTVGLTVDAVNHLPAAADDAGRFGLGVAAVVDVLANDRDPDGDALRVVAVDGRPIAPGQPVMLDHGTVSLGSDGRLSFAPAAGYLGTEHFTYTIDDSHGGQATGAVTVGPDGPVLPVAPDMMGAAAGEAGALAAAGVTTLDVAGDAATLTDAQARALIDAGLHFAEGDAVTLAAQGTHLTTSLKGLQALHVDTVSVSADVVTLGVEAGGTLGSVDAAALPHFTAPGGDGALDVTLSVASGAIDPALDMGSLASALGRAGIDHLAVEGDGRVALTMAQGAAVASAGIDFAPAADVTLTVSAAEARAAAADPSLLAALHVDHLDVAGDRVSLADDAAAKLVAAGVDFAEGDRVTVTAEGTHLGTTLKGLQALHVDAVRVATGVAVLALDAGGTLSDVSAADLPHFNAAGGGDAGLDVTLNVAAGAIDPSVDLSTLAADLRGAGVDHLGVAGAGGLSLDLPQAEALAGAGLDFARAADVTLDVDAAGVARIAADPSLVAALHVDHLDVGGAVAITEAQAQSLIGAGVDFADGDGVTLTVAGTHMTTSLKGLEALHVDAIRMASGVAELTLAAGGGLDTLTADHLPSFTVAQGDAALDVTLTVDAGTLDRGFDAFALAPSLAQAGIDHIGVAGSGTLGLSLQQAYGVGASGLDFTPAADVVVHLGAAELGGFAAPGEAALLAQVHVNTLDVMEDHATISDDAAANLVAAGLHFAEADAVTVEAHGTHLSTSLRGLHDLGVDAVATAPGEAKLVVDAGDLKGLSASDLPHLGTGDAAALDVTLRVAADELGEVARLGQALAAAGVDHVVTDADLATLSPAEAAALAEVTHDFGIDVSHADFAPPEERHLDLDAARADADLLHELRQGFEGADDDGVGGVYRIADGAHHALAESGLLRAYTADTLVLDGEGSSDKLLATLKDIADMGVDEVKLADVRGGPVYVELGLGSEGGEGQGIGEGADDVRQLLRSLGHGQSGPDPIFQGADKVALVMDADAAHALAQVDGGPEQLKAVGITEIDVVTTPGDGPVTPPAFGDAGLEVKLIGQDDELYRHLHQDR